MKPKRWITREIMFISIALLAITISFSTLVGIVRERYKIALLHDGYGCGDPGGWCNALYDTWSHTLKVQNGEHWETGSLGWIKEIK